MMGLTLVWDLLELILEVNTYSISALALSFSSLILDSVKANTSDFHFVLILAVPVDKSSSVSPLPHVIKILIWLACAFVLEASERKTQLIFNTIFLF